MSKWVIREPQMEFFVRIEYGNLSQLNDVMKWAANEGYICVHTKDIKISSGEYDTVLFSDNGYYRIYDFKNITDKVENLPIWPYYEVKRELRRKRVFSQNMILFGAWLVIMVAVTLIVLNLK